MQVLDESDNPLTPPDASEAATIRGILSASGYLSRDFFDSPGNMASLSGESIAASISDKAVDTSAAAVFEKLFYRGVVLNREVVEQAISPMSIDDWVRLGLLRSEGVMIRASVQLLAYRNLIIAHDFKEQNLSKNHVIGVTPASHSLVRLTIRRPSRYTLDLGSGSGVQALMAAGHSDKVIATDINQRAVNIAEFNASLNGFGNMENAVGDLFEPVAGKSFDLIVSCPPFVISPDNHFYYLDSGGAGDSMLERIVRESAGHLNEGGYCQLMCEVVQYSGQEWPQRLLGWLDGIGCDAWMLHRITMSPSEYARVWVTDRSESPEVLMQEWLAYYREHNIESITSGLLTIRKRSDAVNWFRVDQLPAGIGDCGVSIDKGFRARDFLGKRRDTNSFLSARLRLADDARLNGPENNYQTAAATGEFALVTVAGFSFSDPVDRFMAMFLNNCEKYTTVGEAITATERACKEKISRDKFVSVLGGLVLKGYLVQA